LAIEMAGFPAYAEGMGKKSKTNTAKRLGTKPSPKAKANGEKIREAVLAAAIGEFYEHGLGGARVDAIAQRAKTNKRYLYLYVGNKQAIWLAALERVYEIMRTGERELKLENLSPDEGMRLLIRFNFWFHVEHPEFISMLNDENRQKGRNLRHSTKAKKMYSPLLAMIEGLLRRGEEAGLFRAGVDPVQLYISIAALSYFYCSNQHTLSAIFGQDLGSKVEMLRREEHVVAVIIGYLARPSQN
jgi:AcrR family transcriptional regulator